MKEPKPHERRLTEVIYIIPNNCIWATPLVQAQNTRMTGRVRLGGEEISVAEAARRLGVDPMVVYHKAAGDRRRGKRRVSNQEAVDAVAAMLGGTAGAGGAQPGAGA